MSARPNLRNAAVLFALTIIAYFPALNGQALWDDDRHITAPILRTTHGLWRIWFNLGATQQYYPLLHSAFWTEHLLWGDAVLGYHLTNVLLHALAACLFAAVLRKLDFTETTAWLAAFLFALHPISVEAVAWISEQKCTLSAVFYFAAALAYLNFDQTRKRQQYVLALTFFIAALLTKSVTATLPAALLLVIWWKRNGLDWIPLTPFFAAGAISGLFTAWVERTYIGAQGADYALTFPDRLVLAGRVVWFYLAKIALPIDLMFFYPRWNIDATQWWQWLFTAALLALVFYLRKRRGPFTALLFFLITLFPVLGFLNVYPFVYSWVADHFAYLASLAVIVPVAALIGNRLPVAAALVGILAILTWRETHIYKDVETLYTETLERNPESWISHNNLGDVLLANARVNESIGHFTTAIQLKPDSASAHNNLGSAYMRQGHIPEAIAEFQTALHYRANYPLALDNLGSTLLKMPGRGPEALADLENAVRLDPDFANAHNNLGVALSRIPARIPEAIAQYKLALELDPASVEAHNNLAEAYARSNRMPDAIRELEAALALKPDLADVHENLAIALRQSGRKTEALTHLAAAIQYQPNAPQFHINLGNALLEMPDRVPEAIAQFRIAVQLNPNLFAPHYLLGLALLRTPGHADEAISQIEAALKIQPDPAAQRVVDKFKLIRR